MSGGAVAKKMGITPQRVDRVIRNSYASKDNIDSDHEYVSREIVAEVTRKASRKFPLHYGQ